ncbi:cation-transporting P-type ATPase [Desulfomicrobium orale]|nr:cation-transporting P-type ATPase [Desulfomicrobium orale]
MDFFTGRLWHHLSSTETLETFETDPDKGLDRFQVQRRAAEFGPNALTTRKGKTRLERLLLQFHILRILLVGGTLLLAGAEIMAMAVLAFLVVEFEKSMRMRKL